MRRRRRPAARGSGVEPRGEHAAASSSSQRQRSSASPASSMRPAALMRGAMPKPMSLARSAAGQPGDAAERAEPASRASAQAAMHQHSVLALQRHHVGHGAEGGEAMDASALPGGTSPALERCEQFPGDAGSSEGIEGVPATGPLGVDERVDGGQARRRSARGERQVVIGDHQAHARRAGPRPHRRCWCRSRR